MNVKRKLTSLVIKNIPNISNENFLFTKLAKI